LWFSAIFCRLSIPNEKENENEERVRFGVLHHGHHWFELIVRGLCPRGMGSRSATRKNPLATPGEKLGRARPFSELPTRTQAGRQLLRTESAGGFCSDILIAQVNSL
jgi:hypothetical protein